MIRNKCLLSFIVIVYNNEKYINKCLNNLKKIADENIEIIIVDDGSTDKSNLKIKKFVSNSLNIKLVEKENGGISSARNAGLKLAEGEYIAFIDGDDWIVFEELIKSIDIFRKENADIYVMNTTKYYESNNLYENEIYDFKQGYITKQNLIDNKIFGRAWRFIIKREFLKLNNISFHKGLIYEDEEYVPKIISYTEKIFYLDFPYYIYRKNNISITSSINYKKTKNLMKIVESTFSWYKKIQINKKYVFWSLARCIRNIFSSAINFSEFEQKQILKWYYKNKKMILSIISVRYLMLVSVVLFGPINGIRLYKKYFKKKYKYKYKKITKYGDDL